MIDPRVQPRFARRLFAALFVLTSALLFWKLRILDLGTNPRIEIGPIDLYIEHVPMAEAAYDALARGRVPLWNPYQLGGLPFLAVPHVGILYPLHLFSLWVSAEVGVEISFVLHMWLGGLGTWLLVRRLGMSALSAAAGALTFMWSGWLVFAHVVPTVFAGLCWLPVTIFLLERAIDRERLALVVLVPAVACQILVGASEVLVHTLLVAAVWTAARLGQRARIDGAAAAARAGGAIAGAMGLAALLATPQLLPSLELVAWSGRGDAGMSLEAAAQGAIPPTRFLAETLGITGLVCVGFLPFVALPLLFTSVRDSAATGRDRAAMGGDRFATGMALGLALAGALLVFGGTVYEAYHAIPGIGALFRRPVKFLDVHAFGQALLAAVAIARLEALAARPRAELVRRPSVHALLVLLAAATVGAGVLANGRIGYWLGALLALAVLIALPVGRGRRVALMGLVALQAACLFFGAGATHVRPVVRPGIYHRQDALLERLRQQAGHQRIYLSDAFLADPALTAKQGTLAGLRVATDYEPLVTRRSQRFYELVTPGDQQRRMNPFAGVYALRPDSRWPLLDLTATRLLVMSAREPVTRWMRSRPEAFRPLATGPGWQVFERERALPRAFLAADFEVHEDDASMRAALAAPEFDAHGPVLLDRPPSFASSSTAQATSGQVEFVRDEPETVEIRVVAPGPRLLVLSDTDYPGWRASVDGREVPILRANYLFRAVEVGAGEHVVQFRYAPRSWRAGLGIGAVALVVLVVVAVLGARRRVT